MTNSAMYLLHTFIIIYVFLHQTFNIDHCEVDITAVFCVWLCTSRRIIDGCAHDWADAEQGVQDRNEHVDLRIWYGHDPSYGSKPFLLWKVLMFDWVSMNMLEILTTYDIALAQLPSLWTWMSFEWCGVAQECWLRHVGWLPKGRPWQFRVQMKKT